MKKNTEFPSKTIPFIGFDTIKHICIQIINLKNPEKENIFYFFHAQYTECMPVSVLENYSVGGNVY